MPLQPLRRTIHPQTRVLDAQTGLVEYVASDETLDSYNEIVKASGARFDRFEKNAPFVDSHNYESIDCLLGQVVDFRVTGRRVVETVQWAIDVPTNLLAQKGFQMTAAGYLKAVSIGFMPVSYVTKWDSNPTAFQEALKDMNVAAGTDVRTIYLEWSQMELSACVVGANPNAVAQIEKAYQAGILDDSDIKQFSALSRDFARAFERRNHQRRAYSFPAGKKSGLELLAAIGENPTTQPQSTMNKNDFSTEFDRLTGTTKGALESIELARRNGSPRELERIMRRAFAAVAQEKQASHGDPIARYFEENPERRLFWNGIARRLSGTLRAGTPEYKAVESAFGGKTGLEEIAAQSSQARAVSGINLQDNFGAGMLLAIPVADEVYDLLLNYGAYKYLGLRRMVGQYTSYAQATGWPTAVFITPTYQGTTTIPADTTLAGRGIVPAANSIASLITVSREWLGDEKVDLSEVLFSKFVQGTAQRIDYGCFQGNGANDPANGMTTGIFFDPAIGTVNSAIGAGTIAGLTRPDFINVLGAVNAAALQRMDQQPPRWYINPAFIPLLLGLWDGQAHNYLLKTPAETGGEWLLVGFPVTWATAAPANNAVGTKALAFGNPDAYLVALHEDFEISPSEEGPTFANNQTNFRSIGRGKSMTRDASGLVTLTLR